MHTEQIPLPRRQRASRNLRRVGSPRAGLDPARHTCLLDFAFLPGELEHGVHAVHRSSDTNSRLRKASARLRWVIGVGGGDGTGTGAADAGRLSPPAGPPNVGIASTSMPRVACGCVSRSPLAVAGESASATRSCRSAMDRMRHLSRAAGSPSSNCSRPNRHCPVPQTAAWIGRSCDTSRNTAMNQSASGTGLSGRRHGSHARGVEALAQCGVPNGERRKVERLVFEADNETRAQASPGLSRGCHSPRRASGAAGRTHRARRRPCSTARAARPTISRCALFAAWRGSRRPRAPATAPTCSGQCQRARERLARPSATEQCLQTVLPVVQPRPQRVEVEQVAS